MSVRGGGIELDGLLEFLDRFVEPAAVGQLDPAGVVLIGPDDLVLALGVATHVPQITRKEVPGPLSARPRGAEDGPANRPKSAGVMERG